MRLSGKRVLITGGARGIGQGIASRFIQEGASVFLIDMREEQLAESVELLKQQAQQIQQAQAVLGTSVPAQVESAVCDLSVPEQIEAAAAQAWSRLGGLDILINNAGIAVRETFTDIPYQRWLNIINVNLNATFLLSQWVSKQMIANEIQGSIVNMASKNGLSGSSMLAHYNASKGGVVLLTQSMAVDLAKHGIRVNAVAPGFIDTPLDRELKKEENTLQLSHRTPMGRLGTIEETANAFLFLASDEASYITGTTLVVDGGHLANAGEV
ncbi:SDR family NAD(P)-dependent oxidoreductase [Paenibacillus eucommiae]|uniref:NAD(P)-dependent dehydrogenase (Short-subunit alcohol dehydrogenase family) n=1 Tax=Paenibacillus eucommiae TaxID=1355755 RepID=A0ABS4IT86_9BACL|nr:SDR family NAD(P)-dependent oxidoreductase [Paenibacillus eucommiae]MBP1990772.1 NAD(P)-dependent dehydrogenase (short-subunit alcohol dehydrogenase family) [Paenibacillus eucommiae]